MTETLAVAISAFLLGLLLTAGKAHAHGTAYPRPTAEQAASIPLPIEGAGEVLDRLSRHGRHLFDQEELLLLDEAVRSFGVVDQIARGEIQNPGPHDAAYNRHLGEQALLRLLEKSREVVQFDFASGALPDPYRPMAMPGQECVAVVKVSAGGEGLRFQVDELDLHNSGDPGPYAVQVGPGVTYLLLDVAEFPPGKHQLQFAFHTPGSAEPRFWHGITFDQGAVGNLRVEIQDETGAVTPAFVRLTALKTGKLWEPPNAIDLGPIMTSITGLPIYGPGRGYTHHLPGENKGTYWIVPDPFELALPPGAWEIYIYHGPEYDPIRDTFTVEAGTWVRKRYTLNRWTCMPARGWWPGDDHVHARLMNSEDARRIMAFARAADIHVANVLEMGNTVRTWYAQRGFGPGFRVQEGDYWLVPGQEDPRSAFGHAIGLNLTGLVRDPGKYMLNDWVADEIHKQGGLYGHTHVGEGGLGIRKDMTLLMPRGKSDFGSIMQNRLGTERYYEFLNLGFKLAASAGSDVPYGGAVGVVRCYGYVGEGDTFTPDAWFEAVRRGRTFVTNGPMLNFRVNGALPGDELPVADGDTLEIVARAWGRPGASAPVRLMVVCNGDVVQERTGDGREGLELEAALPAGTGGWYALHAVGLDGSEAHTTPVYAKRDGFRHWSMEKAGAHLDLRMATLREIEAIVDEAEAMKREGQLATLDHWHGCVADQAEAIRERVALVREIYEGLYGQLARERASRKEEGK